ncbi:hypothetical protein TNCV_4402471 [Trichonephila clavipes]|uniref:Uncharacterized protein n=1 Tax=Trichonephila clavipes TaxID=2585209 RepID=A0A8X6S6J6_TRICX|nr:hypothetical protein TNCV_4402471 [Trichonephila clavipes]
MKGRRLYLPGNVDDLVRQLEQIWTRTRGSTSGQGSLVVKVSDRGWHVTSSSPVVIKARHVGERSTSSLSRAQRSSRWCSMVVRREECQFSCHPRHLTMVKS